MQTRRYRIEKQGLKKSREQFIREKAIEKIKGKVETFLAKT